MWKHACETLLAETPSEVQTKLSKGVQNTVVTESDKINYVE